MEECNVYKMVGSLNQQGARKEQQMQYCDSKLYMVPNSVIFDDESQHEEFQNQHTSSSSCEQNLRKPVVPTKQHASQSVDSVTRRSVGRWFGKGGLYRSIGKGSMISVYKIQSSYIIIRKHRGHQPPEPPWFLCL